MFRTIIQDGLMLWRVVRLSSYVGRQVFAASVRSADYSRKRYALAIR